MSSSSIHLETVKIVTNLENPGQTWRFGHPICIAVTQSYKLQIEVSLKLYSCLESGYKLINSSDIIRIGCYVELNGLI